MTKVSEIKKEYTTKGLSLTLVFGKYGGVYFFSTSTSWRICLGWVALTIYFVDLEEFITSLKDKVKVLGDELEDNQKSIEILKEEINE